MRGILPKTTTNEEIEKLIADVDDADKDGRVSFEEFKKAFTDENHSKISRLYDGGQRQQSKHSLQTPSN